MATPARRGRLGHVGDDRAQLVDREALLDHERGRQPRRPRALHGEVVDGAVHREVADRAAGEPQRLHDERVGGERQPLAGSAASSVAASASGAGLAVGERLEEHRVDERGRGLAAGAVGQRDDLVGAGGAGGGGTPRCGRAPRPRGRRRRGSAHGAAPRSPRRSLHRRPQREAERGLRLLDAVHAVGAHDEAVLDVAAGGHLAAVVAGQADGQQAAARGLGEGASRFRELPLVESPSAMSPARRVGDELAGEHEVEADVVGRAR